MLKSLDSIGAQQYSLVRKRLHLSVIPIFEVTVITKRLDSSVAWITLLAIVGEDGIVQVQRFSVCVALRIRTSGVAASIEVRALPFPDFSPLQPMAVNQIQSRIECIRSASQCGWLPGHSLLTYARFLMTATVM